MSFNAGVDAQKGSRAYGATGRSAPLGQLPSLETWRLFAAAKKRFDPANVLTPGTGIF